MNRLTIKIELTSKIVRYIQFFALINYELYWFFNSFCSNSHYKNNIFFWDNYHKLKKSDFCGNFVTIFHYERLFTFCHHCNLFHRNGLQWWQKKVYLYKKAIKHKCWQHTRTAKNRHIVKTNQTTAILYTVLLYKHCYVLRKNAIVLQLIRLSILQKTVEFL